jgi:hypothetical protein
MRPVTRVIAMLAALAGVGFGVWWVTGKPPRSDRSEVQPGQVAQPSGDEKAEFPIEVFTKYPPGSRVALRLPRVESGIPLGGGVFLPPLNGVKVEDGIPPIKRDPRLPPPGPVVAKQVDLQGQEWWIHADGSQTSCSYASITEAGVDRVIVSTQHGAARAEEHGQLPAKKR